MITASEWIASDGIVLEPNARTAAIAIGEHVVVTAGPGAGKTELLAQRSDFLLNTTECPYPRRILAISFKVDASANLMNRVRERCGHHLARRLDSRTFHAFARRIIDTFRPVLSGNDALDPDFTMGTTRILRRQIRFTDLLPLANRVVRESPLACNAIRQTYSHVLLDEFQDCTAEQYELIRYLFWDTAVCLTAVGDTKQRIMGFAGAMEGIFDRFRADFSAIPLNLYQNRRSLPRLRRMQNAMVRVMDPGAAAPDSEIQGDEGIVQVLHFADCGSEATAVAQLIRALVREQGVPLAEIAVLVSKQANLYAEPLTRELELVGVPFRNEQDMQDLTVEPLFRLICDFLCVLFGDHFPDASTRLMNSIIDPELDEEEEFQANSTWLSYFATKREQARTIDPTRLSGSTCRSLVSQFVSELGEAHVKGLSPEYEHGDFLHQVQARSEERVAAIFDANEDVSVALLRLADDSAVRILTIHKSKGLEFDTVIILAIENEAFWSTLNDERSAYFVGISRAKRQLVLTTCRQRARPSGATRRWDTQRTPQIEFLGYASDTD